MPQDNQHYILAAFRKFSLELLPQPIGGKVILSVVFHLILLFFLFFSPLSFLSAFKKPRDVSPFFLDPSVLRPGAGSAQQAQLRAPTKEEPKEKAANKDEISIIPKKKTAVVVSTNVVKKSAIEDSAKKKKKEQNKWQEEKLKNIQKLLKEGISPVAVNPVVSSAGAGSASGGGTSGGSGSGGGGAMDPYSLYYAAIYSALYDVWQQPSGLAGKGLSVTALLRVARDGTILERRILRKSGNSVMDSSVQNAIEAVNRFPQFPPELGFATKDITVEFVLTEDQM